MSADFWAGYISGAIGIIVGNPLDLLKTRLQAGDTSVHATSPESLRSTFDRAGTLVRGATAPVLTYGALNALLFVSYNRTLTLLDPASTPYAASNSLSKIWVAGAAGGLATFVVSAPTELIKCRAQVARDAVAAATAHTSAGGSSSSSSSSSSSVHSSTGPSSSIGIAKAIWKHRGLRGLYFGGGVTSIRDAVGYGFYFWSYELARRSMASPADGDRAAALKVLLYGGVAGVVTWATIFPLDVVKTRVQTQPLLPWEPELRLPPPPPSAERTPLLRSAAVRLDVEVAAEPRKAPAATKGAVQMAREAYRNEGVSVFFRGFGICTVRGFVVSAVQFFVYEWMMRVLQPRPPMHAAG